MTTNTPNFAELLAEWQGHIVAFVPRLLVALLVLLVTLAVAALVRRLVLHVGRKLWGKRSAGGQADPAELLGILAYVLLALLGVAAAVDVLGLTGIFTKVLASAGVVGIVVGFATQELTANFFSGVFIGVQKPFRAGDWVEINGVFGRVQSIGSMLTDLRTPEGRHIFIANRLIYASNVTNYSALGRQRAVLTGGVAYGEDLDRVKRVALQAAQQTGGVLTEPDWKPDFYYTEIGASNYNFELRCWLKFENHDDYLETLSNLIMQVKAHFDAEGITIAYNVTTLDFGIVGGVALSEQQLQVRLEETARAPSAAQPPLPEGN